jgi:epoxyqueuosine reductase
MDSMNYIELKKMICRWADDLGFQQVGIAGIDLSEDEKHLFDWLDKNRHGDMHYMHRHGTKRTRPEQLLSGTYRIISARMDYYPPEGSSIRDVLKNKQQAFISRYATGRDYHKLMRTRLQKLADHIKEYTGDFGYRAFVDSAPVLEKALARNAGLGWIGKHSNLINPKAGSWFFLGELYTDLPLPIDERFSENHCGTCQACIDICPTDAIIAPYQVDARKCISYLTIELRTSIPEQYRRAMGNRIYGCDDCQLVCPWNRFSKHTQENDFSVRHGLDSSQLVDLFNWTEKEFLNKTEGSAIRRIGYECWLRNIAIALGNSDSTNDVLKALNNKRDHPSELVKEHVAWALEQHESA